MITFMLMSRKRKKGGVLTFGYPGNDVLLVIRVNGLTQDDQEVRAGEARTLPGGAGFF